MSDLLIRLKKNEEFYKKCCNLHNDFDNFFPTIETVLGKIDKTDWINFIIDCATKNNVSDPLQKYLQKNTKVVDVPRYQPQQKLTIWSTFLDLEEKRIFEEENQKDPEKRQLVVSTFTDFVEKDLSVFKGKNLKEAYRKALMLGFPISKTTLYPLYLFTSKTVILKEHPIFLIQLIKDNYNALSFTVECYTHNELKCVDEKATDYIKSKLVPITKIETPTYENIALVTSRVVWSDKETECFAFTKEQLTGRVLCMDEKLGTPKTINKKWGTNNHFQIEMLKKTAIYATCKNLGLADIYSMDCIINAVNSDDQQQKVV